MKVFIFGYGYTATFFAHHCLEKARTVHATQRQATYDSSSITVSYFDGQKPLSKDIFYDADIILSTIPPDPDGLDPVLRFHAQDFKALAQLKWLGYLSATSVYGDREGAWVDETTTPHPTSPSGKRRLTAENQWLSLYAQSRLPVHIFRLSGIYGPNRSILDRIQASTFQNIFKENHLFSRIHVADIIQTLEKSINAPVPGAIYNVTDDYPAPFHEVAEYAALLAGQALPKRLPFNEAVLSERMREFFSESKRLSNDKIKRELGVCLKYPSYKEGLKAIYTSL